jgi:hypothetical protein
MPNTTEPQNAGVIDFTNPLAGLISTREEEKAKTQQPNSEPPASTPPADEPADAPKPQNWQGLEFGKDEELPDNYFRGRKVTDLFDSNKEMKKAMQEAQRRANLAEAKAAAAETQAEVYKERMKQTAIPPDPPRADEPLSEEDWVLNPAKARRSVTEEAKREILPETQKLIDQALQKERDRQKELDDQNKAIKDLQDQARDAAKEALEGLGIPKEHWGATLDIVIPELTKKGSELAAAGGPLVADNYKKVITRNPIVKAGIEAIVGTAKAAPPASAPPGVKAPAAPVEAPKTRVKLSNEARQFAVSMARGSGLTDEKDIQAFVDRTAARIEQSKLKRRGSK